MFPTGTLTEVRFAFPDENNSSSDVDSCKMKEIQRTDLKKNEVCYINGELNIN